MKSFVKLFLLILILLPVVVSAEVKEIICEGTLQYGRR
jgi:hypothetical protein